MPVGSYTLPVLSKEVEDEESSMLPPLRSVLRIREVPGEVLEASLRAVVSRVYQILKSLDEPPLGVALSQVTVNAALTSDGRVALVGEVGAAVSDSITLTFDVHSGSHG